ncbi:inorganic phosphate transporter [Halorubellus sp. JP-L1]|uniref:inorganic phosphate transporter n=1 Tax=Halorubellus sp. JP-L1 TaxID=2715753 RepID=UPI00140773A8|nr:inorganic phosphate transporter [Halorubellus sp. JP-L1]NHN43582.1 inorganic phosphate transporter [Halorubellus sp. JP-L1]
MVDAGTLVTLGVAGVASLFMAWTIGAGSSGSTPFAPAVGANAIGVMRAGFVVGILGFAGAVLQGANVTEAVGSELVLNASLSAEAATVGLIVAAVLVAVGVYTGYPIATAFTVTGAVVGVGLAMGGDPAMAKYQELVVVWSAIPFVGGFVAYVTARLLRSERVSERVVVPVLAAIVGAIVANIGFTLLGPAGETRSMAAAIAVALDVASTAGVVAVTAALALAVAGVLALDLRSDEATGQQHFLVALGGLVAFSAGGSQVGLAIGPLTPLVGEGSAIVVPLVVLLVGGGFGLLVGSWTGAPRMIKALSQDYSSLGPRRSIAALIPAFSIAQVAIFLGVPVSFNEIIVSTIVGSGYAAGSSGVSREKMLKTVAAWIGSLVLSFVVAYAGFWVVDAVLL